MFRIVVLQLRFALNAFGLALVLAACSSAPTQAPVTDLSPSVATPATPAPSAQQYYTVKRGDTLFSIAQQFGQDYRQVATWNDINNGYHIHLGQVLRLTPPEAPAAPPAETQGTAEVAESAPVTGSQIEQQPLGANPSAPGANSGAAPTESAPSGVKRPYSDAVLAEMSRPEGVVPSSAAVAGAAAAPEAPEAPAGPTAPEALAAPAASAPANPGEPGATKDVVWGWPANGPLIGEFSESKNKGIDIGGQSGTDVVAAADGRVIYIGAGVRGLGNLVVIKHNTDLISVYGHNSKILVTAEESVKKGQKIAEMGNSDASQVELHFEVRRQGKPVDPLKYLPTR